MKNNLSTAGEHLRKAAFRTQSEGERQRQTQKPSSASLSEDADFGCRAVNATPAAALPAEPQVDQQVQAE